ncbi:hypothetical protein BJ508DRAFT_350901 [Ascobolus immersus RN42]|uniref:F-box domain-containing protein n=1 Tax=Ascobolus immersus RN42 TaxID=1160509 RepID=A0A3N4HYH0_ASCIM|nr:hypothetical protein BJ508DRAFT_350901 [Ascobolus immersus RN42]
MQATRKNEMEGSCLVCGAPFYAASVITSCQQVNVGPDNPELAYAVNGTLFLSSSLNWLKRWVCLDEANDDKIPIHEACQKILDAVLERNQLPTTSDVGLPVRKGVRWHEKCGPVEQFYSRWLRKYKHQCTGRAKATIAGLSDNGFGIEYWDEESAFVFAYPEPPSLSVLRELDQYAQNKSISHKRNEDKTDLAAVKALPYGRVPQLASSTVTTPYRLPHRGYADERTEIIDEIKTCNQDKTLNEGTSGLLGLPNELIARITHFLPRATDVIKLQQVCQRLHDSVTAGKQLWEDHIRDEFWFLQDIFLKLDPNYFENRDATWLKFVYRSLRSDCLPVGIGSDLLWGVQSDPGLESLQWKNLKRIHSCAEDLSDEIKKAVSREISHWRKMERRDSGCDIDDVVGET